MIASLITYPHEVLRTRMQTRRTDTSHTATLPKPTTTPAAKSSSASHAPPEPSTSQIKSASIGKTTPASAPSHIRPAFHHHALPLPSFHLTHLYSPLVTGSEQPFSPGTGISPDKEGKNGRRWIGRKGGIIHTFMKIKRQDHLAGFYRGLIINLVRTIPNSAVTMLS